MLDLEVHCQGIRQRRDDESACALLYREHLAELLNQARQRGVDEHEAFDIVQELFLRVFRLRMLRVLAARPYHARRSWLMRSLRWMIINEHRSRTRLRRGGRSAIESLDLILEEGTDIAGGETPSSHHDRRWALDVIERALIRLRDSLKPTLWPVIERSLSGESSATNAQRVATHRARLRLRTLIGQEASYGELIEATR